MAEKEVFLTAEGLSKLEAELEHLVKVRRPEVAERIRRAKELGSTANNAEYDDAKNEQAFVEGRILTLENIVKHATVIPPEKSPSDWIKVGSRVAVLTEEGEPESYSIVGSAEAAPAQGKISNESPVGRALLGHRVGEKVEVLTPAGVTRLLILEIR